VSHAKPVGVIEPVTDATDRIDDRLGLAHGARSSLEKACTAAAIRVPPVIQHISA
jgi:hypothetical protein